MLERLTGDTRSTTFGPVRPHFVRPACSVGDAAVKRLYRQPAFHAPADQRVEAPAEPIDLDDVARSDSFESHPRLKHFTDGLGAEVVFAIEAFGTRVAMVRLAPDPPPLLFAGHLEGDQPILMYRVENLDQAIARLRARHVDIGLEFEIPHGRGAEITNPGPQRLAVYERTRPGADERLAGRRDF